MMKYSKYERQQQRSVKSAEVEWARKWKVLIKQRKARGDLSGQFFGESTHRIFVQIKIPNYVHGSA